MSSKGAAQVTADSIVARRHDRASAEIDEVTAVMSVDAGAYFLLDTTASRLWGLIEHPVRVRDLCRGLTEEFDIDLETCQADVLEFLNDAAAKGLLTVG